ncbi:alpha-glucuronidase [Aureococcus anophagefferens]|nr:alpha-glucuronidase [Aureococcus anophagefferens]
MAAIVMRFAGLLLLLTDAAVAEDLDELWLRSELVEDAKLRSSYVAQLSSIRVSGDAGVSRIQLETAAQELRTSSAPCSARRSSPNLGTYHHPLGERDYQNQQFTVREAPAPVLDLAERVGANGAPRRHLNVNGIDARAARTSYGSSNYSDYGLGCDRTSSGTGYAEFYAPEVRDMFEDVDACPVKNLLWFHNVPWTRPMPTPANYTPATADATVPLYDYIRFQHYDAVAQVAELAKRWDALEGRVDDARFSGVKARFAQQVRDATVMCDTIMGQFDAWYHSG